MAAEREWWRALVRAPMFRAFLPFSIGIAISLFVRVPFQWTAVLFLSLALVFLVLHKLPIAFEVRWVHGLAVQTCLLNMGLFWGTVRAPGADQADMGKQRTFKVHLIEQYRSGGELLRFRAVTIAGIDGDRPVADRRKLLVLLSLEDGEPGPQAGDMLWVTGTLRSVERSPDPGGFDRGSWLRSKGIHAELYVRPEDRFYVGHSGLLARYAQAVQGRLVARLKRTAMDEDQRGIVQAVVLGAREDLSGDDRDAFARSGTMHVLAVSGMHVGLVYLLLDVLLRVLGSGPVQRWIRAGAMAVALVTYALITGSSPSVMRATLMCLFFVLAGAWGRQSSSLNSVFGAGFLLLAIDPLMIRQLSFQLSFMAVLGIVLFYRVFRDLWSAPNKVLRYLWEIASVSMAAQLGTLAVSLYHFGSFPTYFLPANLLVVSCMFLVLCGGILLLFVSGLPMLADPLATLLNWSVQLMTTAAGFLGSLPFAYPAVRIDALGAIVVLLCIASAGYLIITRARWSLNLFIATLCMVFISWGVRARRTATTEDLIVLDERDALVACYRQGHRAWVIADTVVGEDAPYLERKLDRMARALGVSGMEFVAPPGDRDPTRELGGAGVLGSGTLITHGLRVRFGGTRSSVGIGSTGTPSILLIRSVNDTLLAQASPWSHAVLSPEMDGLDRWRVRQCCERNTIPCHDVRRDGAFQLTRSHDR
ncbi:MAG: ComEC/Rec2 family competence protein [Flavobacteriales bacterium]|nr:ComEC/Rec2 family competence protein [Flavobacteriales bacterium]